MTDRARVNAEYDRIALAIAAYEDSPDVNAFTSKFDAWRAGQAMMTLQELRGFALFQGKGRCSRCHPSAGKQALFTDFTYETWASPRTRRTRGCSPLPRSVTGGWAASSRRRVTPPRYGCRRKAR